MRIEMLGEAIPSLLEPLKRVAESKFEVSLESGETGRCFPKMASNCRDNPEIDFMSSVWHCAGRQHPFVNCHSTHEGIVIGRGAQAAS